MTVNGSLWTWQSGDSRVVYDSAGNLLNESFGVGGTARIEGLGQDQAGNVFYTKLNYEEAVNSQQSYHENFENGKLTEWGYSANEVSLLRVTNDSSQPWISEEDWLSHGNVEIHAPSLEIPGPESDPAANVSFDNLFMRLRILDGKIVEASVEAKPAKAFQAGEDKRLDKNLYLLVNGIYPDITKEGYMRNLQIDLAEQSQFQVDPLKDVIVPLVFPPVFFIQVLKTLFQNNMPKVITTLQQLMDVLRLINEQKGDIGSATQDVINGVKAFAGSNGVDQLLRAMVGVGYSGGFVPLVEAMVKEGYNAASLVALGGFTLAIGEVLAKAIGGLIQQMEKLATARDQATRDAYRITFQILGAVLRKIPGSTLFLTGIDLFMQQLDGFYDTLNQTNFPQKVEEVYSGLRGLIQQMSGFNWGPVENTHAGLVVNIWGSEDPLAKIGIGGYRSNIGGYSVTEEFKPLFNVEIEGADHYDYVYGVHDFEADFPDPIKRAEAIRKNEIVSGYVTRMILKAQDAISFQAHLSELIREEVLILVSPNTYRLRVL